MHKVSVPSWANDLGGLRMRLVVSSFLALSTLASGFGSYAQEPSEQQPAHPVQGNVSLTVEKPQLDNTPKKPFTLNIQKIDLQDDLQQNMLQQQLQQEQMMLKQEAAKADSSLQTGRLDMSRFSLEATKNFRKLADYNLELIVDRSMSMHQLDCPGGLSRWEWCGSQASNLASALARYQPAGLTVIPFATEYDVFEHAKADSIQYIFQNVGQQLGTRLYEPLAECLDTYFAHRNASTKPLMLVVITDGVPFPKFEPALVKNELIASSKKMTSPGDVIVVFCQIGDRDRKGQEYLTALDDNLTNDGAKYHFVHTVPFDVVQQRGLGETLVACVEQFGERKAPGATKLATKITSKPVKCVSAQKK